MVIRCVKRWFLTKGVLDEADLLWCRGLGIRIDIKRHDQIAYTSSRGQQYRISGTAEIFLITNDVKQEQMLTLKYGNEIVLHTQALLDDFTSHNDEYGTLY